MRKDQCFACGSRKCGTRIWAAGFDEIACFKHVKELEALADTVLMGAVRIYTSGYQARRGKTLRSAKEFADCVVALKAEAEAIRASASGVSL